MKSGSIFVTTSFISKIHILLTNIMTSVVLLFINLPNILTLLCQIATVIELYLDKFVTGELFVVALRRSTENNLSRYLAVFEKEISFVFHP